MRYFPHIILVFFATLSLALNFYFYTENEKNKEEIFTMKKTINESSNTIQKIKNENRLLKDLLEKTEIELQETKQNLDKTTTELKQAKEKAKEKEEELNITKNILNKTKEEIDQLTQELLDLQETITESIEWFKKNSELPNNQPSFLYRIEQKCMKDNRLNVACIAYLMNAKLNLEYIKEENDKLFSLDEIIKRGGGDCEDFALFLKATINTIKSIDNKSVIEGWEEGGGRYVIYVEKTDRAEIEYYFNGNPVPIGKLSELQPYVVCYCVDYYTGHCIIALSENKISDVNDIKKINNAKLLEPQTGMYVGEIGKTLFLCDENQTLCERMPGRIMFIISDDDLYQFKNSSWKSNSLYSQKIKQLMERLEEMK